MHHSGFDRRKERVEQDSQRARDENGRISFRNTVGRLKFEDLPTQADRTHANKHLDRNDQCQRVAQRDPDAGKYVRQSLPEQDSTNNVEPAHPEIGALTQARPIRQQRARNSADQDDGGAVVESKCHNAGLTHPDYD